MSRRRCQSAATMVSNLSPCQVLVETCPRYVQASRCFMSGARGSKTWQECPHLLQPHPMLVSGRRPAWCCRGSVTGVQLAWESDSGTRCGPPWFGRYQLLIHLSAQSSECPGNCVLHCGKCLRMLGGCSFAAPLTFESLRLSGCWARLENRMRHGGPNDRFLVAAALAMAADFGFGFRLQTSAWAPAWRRRRGSWL